AAYMASDAAGSEWTGGAQGFPYARVRGSVALIGVNSAVTTPPLIAWGSVGSEQRERLRRILQRVGEAGLFRLVLIHHPPVPGLASGGRELRDAAKVESVLIENGAELVIY